MGFKAKRIKLDDITFDLDTPILNPVDYQTIRRMPRNKAVEELVKKGHLKAEKELRRQKAKEDALIRALKEIGGIFVR
jgi:hypothetical protein